MKKSFLMFFVISVILIIHTIANAMTGLEFMKISSASEKRIVLEPVIIEYVSQGYKNVPDWSELSNKIEKAIRKNGWGNRDIHDIALDAAKAQGMTK